MNQDQHLQQLAEYIRQQLGAGIEPDPLVQQLRQAGWSDEHITGAFQMAHAAITPSVAAINMGAGSQQSKVPQAQGTQMGRIKTGWLILVQSCRVLMGNKYLLRYMGMTYVFVFVSFTALMLFYFVLIMKILGGQKFEGSSLDILLFIVGAIYYLAIMFIINFYAAALAANMLDIFRGQHKPYQHYIGLARQKIVPIFVFSLFSASVGLFLQYVVERIRVVGWILAWLLGTVWSLATIFVLPLIMETDASAPKAVKQSVSYFKATWGENIIAKTSVNVPLFLIQMTLAVILWFIIMLVGPAIFTNAWTIFIAIFLYFAAFVTLAVVGSFANSLLNVSLYYYAAYHQVPPSFSEELLNKVLIKRKRRFFKKIDDTPNATSA